jgi:hypothetical protein
VLMVINSASNFWLATRSKGKRRSGPTKSIEPESSRASMSETGHSRHFHDVASESASLIGRLGSSTFRLSTTAVSMSLTGSRFSSESAPRPFQYGIRGRGGTIFTAALPSVEQQDQADSRTHLIHRPARDIFPRRVEL